MLTMGVGLYERAGETLARFCMKRCDDSYLMRRPGGKNAG